MALNWDWEKWILAHSSSLKHRFSTDAFGIVANLVYPTLQDRCCRDKNRIRRNESSRLCLTISGRSPLSFLVLLPTLSENAMHIMTALI